jgi:hypothetical protein
MKLTLNRSTIMQAAVWAAAAVGLVLNHGLVPEKYKSIVILVGMVATLVLNYASGTRNPDGSPVALPYAPNSPAILNAAMAAYEAYRAKIDVPMADFSKQQEHVIAAFAAAAAAAQAHKVDSPVLPK